MKFPYRKRSKIRTTNIRIGVVGLYASGKTVFLTSLIDHLNHHDPDGFRLGDGSVLIRKFEEHPLEPGWELFPYRRYRSDFAHQSWPTKTKDRYQYVCSFERSDWPLSTARLTFYDMPGERIADAAMLDMDYAGWSDHVLALLRDDMTYRTCCGDFLGLIDRPPVAEADLVDVYKLALARLICAYKPYVSPSTFLLSTRCEVNKRRTPEDMAGDFDAGLDRDSQFAPLPAAARAAQPELATSFGGRYEAYRTRVVRPLIGALRACHALIVLVDVTMLLAGGVGMYNDNRQILLDLLGALSPGQTRLGKVYGRLASVLVPYRWRPGGITRIAFVAPKLDQVHPDDRDRMEILLRKMLERPARDLDGLRPLFTNCSAVISTQTMPADGGQRRLRGVLMYDETGRRIRHGEQQQFTVSELPEDWPNNWREGAFHFPEVWPQIEPRRDSAPVQVNLDKILDFIMS